MITTLKVNFSNCYGIKKLTHSFNLSNRKAYSIYAPNGTMKTSFAKTCKDFSAVKPSSDLIFNTRETHREIKDQDNNDVLSEQLFVIDPYIENYRSERISTLLVNNNLKEQYENILKTIETTVWPF